MIALIVGNRPLTNNIIDLSKNKLIIAADGGADRLLEYEILPDKIIGDLDSISESVKKKHSKIIIETPDQNKNDLEKGLDWIENHKYTDVTIIGATGLRDDHTLSNIFIIMQKNYAMNIK